MKGNRPLTFVGQPIAPSLTEAHVRLLDAAVDLLEALKAARKKLEIECGGVRPYVGGMPTQFLFPLIDAAIAKATDGTIANQPKVRSK